MPDASARRRDGFAAFRLPQYRAYWMFRLFSSTAIHVQSLAVCLQIYELTNQPFAVGLIGLAEAVPAIGVALLAGHVADVMSRRAILWTAMGVLSLATVSLCVVSLPGWADHLRGNLFPLYGVIFVTGLCRGFIGPASFGIMGQIVPPEHYGNASAWNSNVWQLACVLGPAASGLLYAAYGAAAAYALSATLMAAGWLTLLGIRVPPTRAARPDQPVFESIREGLRFVFGNQVVLAAMSLDLFAVLFGGVGALLVFYSGEILGTGSVGTGLLRAAPAVGSIIVGVYLSYYPVTRRAGRAMLWNVAGYGVCILLFAFSRNFYLCFLFLLLSGGFDAVSVFVRWTMFQLVTPDHMKGRVAAVSAIFVGSSNEIGEFESGTLAKFIGVVPAAVFGGCASLLVTALTAWKAPKLRALDLTRVRPAP